MKFLIKKFIILWVPLISMYKRIISMAPSNTEILYALGLDAEIVAVTRYCDYPERARRKPKIGGWLDIKEGNVIKYEPDLLLTSTFVQSAITNRYKKMGMNVVSVMPTTLVGVFNSVKKIGKLVNRERKAELLVKDMNRKIDEVRKKTRLACCKPRLYIEEWHKPPTVSGNWVPTLARIAGSEYGLIRAGHHSKEVSTEEIQKYDPEVIVVSICGLSDKAPKEWITKRPGWENLKAVRNGQVYVIDDSLLNRPGPRLAEGLETLAGILHPEIFRLELKQ
jgi:iron complex transport system substrate-binding protein